MKIAVIILVFYIVFHTKALPVSSEDDGELNESNIRLRRAFNYERHTPDSKFVEKQVLLLKLTTAIAKAELFTVPLETSTANKDRSNKEDSIRTTTEEQIRTTNKDNMRTTTEEQIRTTIKDNIRTTIEEQIRTTNKDNIRTTTESNSSREQTSVETKRENE